MQGVVQYVPNCGARETKIAIGWSGDTTLLLLRVNRAFSTSRLVPVCSSPVATKSTRFYTEEKISSNENRVPPPDLKCFGLWHELMTFQFPDTLNGVFTCEMHFHF